MLTVDHVHDPHRRRRSFDGMPGRQGGDGLELLDRCGRGQIQAVQSFRRPSGIPAVRSIEEDGIEGDANSTVREHTPRKPTSRDAYSTLGGKHRRRAPTGKRRKRGRFRANAVWIQLK